MLPITRLPLRLLIMRLLFSPMMGLLTQELRPGESRSCGSHGIARGWSQVMQQSRRNDTVCVYARVCVYSAKL